MQTEVLYPNFLATARAEAGEYFSLHILSSIKSAIDYSV